LESRNTSLKAEMPLLCFIWDTTLALPNRARKQV